MGVKFCRHSLSLCHMFPAADWRLTNCGSGFVSFSKTETVCAVEMNTAIVSQHCELEPQVHFKMKSVTIVRWMWCSGTQCAHSFLRWSATSFLLFFHHSLFLWMKDGAEWSTCSGSRDSNGSMNEWEHIHAPAGVWAYKHTRTWTQKWTWLSHTPPFMAAAVQLLYYSYNDKKTLPDK